MEDFKAGQQLWVLITEDVEGQEADSDEPIVGVTAYVESGIVTTDGEGIQLPDGRIAKLEPWRVFKDWAEAWDAADEIAARHKLGPGFYYSPLRAGHKVYAVIVPQDGSDIEVVPGTVDEDHKTATLEDGRVVSAEEDAGFIYRERERADNLAAEFKRRAAERKNN